MDKLEKVKRQVEAANPGVEVRPFALDHSSTTDHCTITDQTEIMENLRVLVNNVGFAKGGGEFKMAPEVLQTQMKLNFYPIVLMTK